MLFSFSDDRIGLFMTNPNLGSERGDADPAAKVEAADLFREAMQGSPEDGMNTLLELQAELRLQGRDTLQQ